VRVTVGEWEKCQVVGGIVANLIPPEMWTCPGDAMRREQDMTFRLPDIVLVI
jgi:hypothetical protein